VAYPANISVSYLSDIERGRTIPSMSTLQRVAEALDKTVVGLLVGTEFSGGPEAPDMMYDYDLGDGRVATCLQVSAQAYPGSEFSAGLVNNLPPEDVYVRLQRDGQEPSMWFMTRDEILALIHVMSGALWSLAIADKESEE
jgi:transcriptional regulator with XRE-family HTH domain